MGKNHASQYANFGSLPKKTISVKIITYLQLFLSDLYGYFKLQDI